MNNKLKGDEKMNIIEALKKAKIDNVKVKPCNINYNYFVYYNKITNEFMEYDLNCSSFFNIENWEIEDKIFEKWEIVE